MGKINVLGTEYTISFSTSYKDKDLEGLSGYTDFDSKAIVINKAIDTEARKRATMRHEIAHAFLFESGMDCSSWGRNEEIVDWIALQFPKMAKVFKELEVAE